MFYPKLAASAAFKTLFREGMSLVEDTAAYLDGPGREESRNLPRATALAYATESMRLTTRLMQVASWLLIWRDADPHTVEWRWYWPEGRTYARSFSNVPPIDGFTGMWAAPVWSNLKIKGTDVARMPGTWKVDVIVDYRKILTEYFTINTPEAY